MIQELDFICIHKIELIGILIFFIFLLQKVSVTLKSIEFASCVVYYKTQLFSIKNPAFILFTFYFVKKIREVEFKF